MKIMNSRGLRCLSWGTLEGIMDKSEWVPILIIIIFWNFYEVNFKFDT